MFRRALCVNHKSAVRSCSVSISSRFERSLAPPNSRKQLSLRLKAAGYEIIGANNGQDGLDKLQALTQGKDVLDVIQLVVYDVEMPIMDGYSMTAKIKGDERLGVLPVIMHSSLAGEANFRKGHEAGCDDYIVKFDPQVLLHAVEQLLQESSEGS